jgi:hypothetical protein
MKPSDISRHKRNMNVWLNKPEIKEEDGEISRN